MGLLNNLKAAWATRPVESPAAAAAESPASRNAEKGPRPQKRILFVEPNWEVGEEFMQVLQQRRPSWEILTAADAAGALERIASGSFDAGGAWARLTGKRGGDFL